jgi:hypothetical protein
MLRSPEHTRHRDSRAHVSHQAPPFCVIVRTNAKLPRRLRADAERSLSNSAPKTFAAAGCWTGL